MAARGELKLFKTVKAENLWRKMLSMLFETGHPWMTFKDPCNLRSPQQHVGVVHSSNLCTEITLQHQRRTRSPSATSARSTCASTSTRTGLDLAKLQRTVRTAVRMLDNVIDINYYSVPQARRSNLRHRPVGLGLMGFQDALYRQHLPYGSDEAVEFADRSMEAVSYYAIQASSELAAERGAYASFEGSLWSRGIFPHRFAGPADRSERGEKYLSVDEQPSRWTGTLRERVQQGRHAQLQRDGDRAHRDDLQHLPAVSQSIEPTYQNLYVKSNLSGEFTVVNPYLVRDLKARGLWDKVMVNDLKYYDGSVQRHRPHPGRPASSIYATAFEVEPRWLVEAASRRQKWIDQAQSLNLYMSEPTARSWTYLPHGVVPRPEDHLLPALAGRHRHREVDDRSRPAQLNAVSRCTALDGGTACTAGLLAWTTRTARPASRRAGQRTQSNNEPHQNTQEARTRC